MNKVGIYYAYWTHDWDADFVPYCEKAASLGFDILEVNSGTVANMTGGERQRIKNAAAGSRSPLSWNASCSSPGPPGQATLARLARRDGKYRLAIVPCEFRQFPREVMLQKGGTVTPEWPIAFARLRCAADDFLARFPCNHIHGCYGDWTAELQHVATLLGVEAVVFDAPA